MSANDSHEPVTVTDKRRIDPKTGEIRETATASAPSGPAPHHPGAEIEALDKETADKVTELTADLQRVQAEFANYRKRSLRDQSLVAERTKAAVVTQLLPVLDDLDAARRHGDLDSGPLKSVADKLVTALEGLGLSGFGNEGEEFDPALHEAVQHEGDGTHPIVGSVLRRGYKVGGQVVRHALVGVVDTGPDEAEEEPAEAVEAADPADNADVASEQAAESDD